jgi:hypothetical protein
MSYPREVVRRVLPLAVCPPFAHIPVDEHPEPHQRLLDLGIYEC